MLMARLASPPIVPAPPCSLQPIIAKGADGKYEAHRPSVVCPQPSPTNVVQLLAAGVFLHVTANPEPAIAMLSAALSGVWPPPRPLQRRLVGAQFVPSAEAGEEGDEAGDAAAWSSSKGAAAASGSGSDAGGSKQTDAAAEAEAEAAKAPAALAAEVAAALFEHCPAVSAADLQKSALVLRLFLGCRAVGEQAADGPSFQVRLRLLWWAAAAPATGLACMRLPPPSVTSPSPPCLPSNGSPHTAGHRAHPAARLPAAAGPGPGLHARLRVGGAGA